MGEEGRGGGEVTSHLFSKLLSAGFMLTRGEHGKIFRKIKWWIVEMAVTFGMGSVCRKISLSFGWETVLWGYICNEICRQKKRAYGMESGYEIGIRFWNKIQIWNWNSVIDLKSGFRMGFIPALFITIMAMRGFTVLTSEHFYILTGGHILVCLRFRCTFLAPSFPCSVCVFRRQRCLYWDRRSALQPRCPGHSPLFPVGKKNDAFQQ